MAPLTLSPNEFHEDPGEAAQFYADVFRPVRQESAFEDVTFHSLCHTAAGFMIELGTHPRVMRQRLDHSSIGTTMDAYGSVLPEVDAEVTRCLDQLLRPSRGLAAASQDSSETGPSEDPRDFEGFRGGVRVAKSC